jgi:hypothetical protein
VKCIPCQYGDHANHHEIVQAVPDGVMGGARCDCRGECQGVRACPYCEGKGCEECDQTGERHRTIWETDDGVTLSVSGSAPLSPEAQAALERISRLAFERMDEAGAILGSESEKED